MAPAFLLALTALLASTAQGALTGKQLFSVIVDIVKASPPGNEFLKMAETGKVDSFVEGHVRGMAVKYGAKDACNSFQLNDGNFAMSPIGRRQARLVRAADPLAADLLSILSSPEGAKVISDASTGRDFTVITPKFASGITRGGIKTVNALSGASQGTSAKNYVTHHLDLSNTGTRSSTAVLTQRVRNLVVQPNVLALFRDGGDDETIRLALYNLFNCNKLAQFVKFYYDLGV